MMRIRKTVLATVSTDLSRKHDVYLDNNCTEGHFVKFNTESSPMCYGIDMNEKLVEIRDGPSSSSDLIKAFCGYLYDTMVFSSGRHLWVRFHSPTYIFMLGDGFSAVFEMVNQLPAPFSCTEYRQRHILNSTTGSLASYNYPFYHENSVQCIWNIFDGVNREIRLTFDFFELPYSNDCKDAYVEVNDGPLTQTNL
ncbi:hypothetical protein OS493_029631 [Desmophyllum pertusum]|uniref:CUB domain-containing protein n=1 Tax=Desmophyllum pertusum TaxID=174260 RepID=A0A9W9ZXL3_9CNID|nr:hypothetical protein OS493_029631 [Desmophyllum pertusum]